MLRELADNFRPVAPPRIFEGAYSEDQYRRLTKVVRENGPWQLILAENFERPEEVIATTSGELPEGVELTWDMLLTNPVFRGYLARQGVCFYPELEDCYYSSRFLEMARSYWGARYAEPETYLFNIQGPTPIGGPQPSSTRDTTSPWLTTTPGRPARTKRNSPVSWFSRP